MTNKAFKKLNKLSNDTHRTSWKRTFAGVAATAVFSVSLTLTFTSLAATVYNVGVAGSDEVTEVRSFSKDPVRIVSDVGIPMNDDDLIGVTSINGGDNSNVTLYKDGHTKVSVDGEEHLLETSGSVQKTIAQAGISLAPSDTINVNLDEIAYDGMEIEIDRAYEVYVEADGEVYTYLTTGCKAGEAVYDLGIEIREGDEFSIPADTFMEEGSTVELLRCSYEERAAVEDIEFGFTEVLDENLFEGQTRIVEPGICGTRSVIYEDKYLGSELVESTELSSEVLSDPVNAVRAVGTKVFSVSGDIVPISNLRLPDDFELDKNGVPADYEYYFDGVATAYYGGGITACGIPAAVGYVAVDPKVIPYGTKLWVASLDGKYVYGYAIAADTGGFVKGGWADMDLYMDTEDECWDFGIRGVRIYILESK